MTKLKLGPIPDDKPVKLTVDLPTELHRDLIAYGKILGREAGQGASTATGQYRPSFDLSNINGLVS